MGSVSCPNGARATCPSAVIGQRTLWIDKIAAWPLFAQGGGTRGQAPAPTIWNPCSVLAAGTNRGLQGFVPRGGAILMLMTKERRTAIRTVRGWAIAVLQEAGAIRECEYHGWMQDRADPHARERAFEIARQDPPAGSFARGGRRRGDRGPGLDRRYLPRMPARGLGNALDNRREQ